MLTKAERLILCNQFEILKALKPHDAEYYEDKIKILQGGFARYYGDIINMVYDDMPKHVSDEVIEILNLYRAIYFSYSELPEEDKESIPEEKIQFEGFDGSEEQDHYIFTDYVLKEASGYQELHHNFGYDTHRNVLTKYRNMLDKWNGLGKKNKLNKDEIKMVLAIK